MKIKTTVIDNGFLRISTEDARKLAGVLPRPGREALVVYKNQHYWLARTRVNGEQVWSIRETSWVLDKGQAVLRADNIHRLSV
jgi:hypothetical protein